MSITLLKSIVSLVLVLTLSIEAYAAEASAVCPNGVILTASVELNARDFRFWENFQLSKSGTYLFGHLRAKNTSGTKAIFSTTNARLSINGTEPQRAYKKTLASEIIDLTGISLIPNEEVEINVYWPAPIEQNVATSSIVLSCSTTNTAGEPPSD
jgi:hypothetical protein